MGLEVKIAITSAPPADGDLTLDEIAVFVDRARRLGVPGDCKPKVRSSFKAGIRRLELTAEPDEVLKGE